MPSAEDVVEAAEPLFLGAGYRGVSLQEVCDGLGIKPASLYHHFPGGKEELYLAVIERRLRRVEQKIQELRAAHPDLPSLLSEFAQWYLGEVRMNMFFMAEMEMRHLSLRGQERLKTISLRHVFHPLGEVFASFSHLLREPFDPELFVTSWMALQSSIPASLMLGDQQLESLLRFQVGLFLEGLLKRPS